MCGKGGGGGGGGQCHQVTDVAVCLLLILRMLFEACDKLFMSPTLSGACFHTYTRTHTHKFKTLTYTHTQTHTGSSLAKQHVLINLLKAICQEIFSIKEGSLNGDQGLPWGRAGLGLRKSCLHTPPCVNKDYKMLLSSQTHRPVTHLNG